MKNLFLPALFLALVLQSCNPGPATKVDPEFEKQLQEKFINAKEGDVIELPEGTFTLNRSLANPRWYQQHYDQRKRK
jgi:hypothetical protein